MALLKGSAMNGETVFLHVTQKYGTTLWFESQSFAMEVSVSSFLQREDQGSDLDDCNKVSAF